MVHEVERKMLLKIGLWVRTLTICRCTGVVACAIRLALTLTACASRHIVVVVGSATESVASHHYVSKYKARLYINIKSKRYLYSGTEWYGIPVARKITHPTPSGADFLSLW